MKKIISLFLAVVMLCSCVGSIQMTASAAGDYTTTARDLLLNGQWSVTSWLTSTTKEEYYRITIPSDGKLTLKSMAYFSTCYTEFYAADAYGYISTDRIFRQTLYGNESTPQTASTDVSLSSGIYYAKVSGNPGQYKMFAGFTSYNTNDAGANSFDNSLYLQSNYMITGALTETDREDWYRIVIPYTGAYNFRISARFGCCYVDLFDYDLTNKLKSAHLHGEELTPVTESYNAVLSQGTYFVKVSGDKGWYNLSWGPLTQENCSHEFENKTVYSTCTTQGYTSHTCKICGYSYADNYKALASHSFTSQTVYPTYFAGGYTVYKCRTCGYVYNDNFTSKLKVTKPTISSIKKGKKQFTVYLTNLYGVDGVQIQYSTSKKFPKKSTKTVSTTKSSKAVKKLKGNKKYYVRVRGYKKVDGKKAYSSWSKVKSVKTK